jgi:hypothetical protein
MTPIGTDINAHFCPFGLQSPPLAAEGAVVFAKACELGLEWIVSKRQGSFHKSGKNSELVEDSESEFR